MREHARYVRGGGTEGKPYLAIPEKELLETNKWSSIFKKQVQVSKVRIDVLRPWINKRINELMGIEDEILVEYIITQLKDATERESTKDLAEVKLMDPKLLVVNLTGFMSKKAQPFVAELWEHMLSAQETEHGVPKAFIQDKKQEIELLKQKSKLLDTELARQKEVKKESALEQIARGRDKSESSKNYDRRYDYSRKNDVRRDYHRDIKSRARRGRYRRSPSESQSRSRSHSFQRSRSRSHSSKRSRSRSYGSRRRRRMPYTSRRDRYTRRRSDSRDSDYRRYKHHRRDESSRSKSSSRSISRDSRPRYGENRRHTRVNGDRSETPDSASAKTSSRATSSYSYREDSMSTSE